MALKNEEKTYLTPNEAADLLMVSPVTVRQWAAKGYLQALTTAGGHRRFLYNEIIRFAKEKGIALQPRHSNDPRVLVVDDDEQLLNFLVDVLRDADQSLEIEMASDGFEAGQKVLSFRPSVILLDLMMPGLNGYDVCTHIRENPATKSIRIVAMTGYYTPENVARIIAAGANACIKKPLDIKQVLEQLGVTKNKHLELLE